MRPYNGDICGYYMEYNISIIYNLDICVIFTDYNSTKQAQTLPGIVDPLMDPLQVAYRANRGVDDAKIFIIDFIHKHLESEHNC